MGTQHLTDAMIRDEMKHNHVRHDAVEVLKRTPTLAEKPLFALKLAKEAVNAAQDSQGRMNAMQTSFALHQLCHSHNQQLYGLPIDKSFLDSTYGESLRLRERYDRTSDAAGGAAEPASA